MWVTIKDSNRRNWLTIHNFMYTPLDHKYTQQHKHKRGWTVNPQERRDWISNIKTEVVHCKPGILVVSCLAPCLVLSCLVLCALSCCVVLCCLVFVLCLSCFCHVFFLPCRVFFHLFCLVLPFRVLSRLVLSCLDMTCLV